MRRQSKEQDAAGTASRAAADALAEAKCDFGGQGAGEDKHSPSPRSRSGGPTKWYVRMHDARIVSPPSMVVLCFAGPVR